MNKVKILTGILAGGAALSLAGAAQAQVQMPGWFGSLSGWYYYDNSHDKFEFTDRRDNAVDLKLHPGDGWGGRAYLGYRFMGPWDFALGAEGSWLSRGKRRALSGPNEPREGAQKADYWASDIELGYNGASDNFGYRLFVGARYANFDHRMRGLQEGSDTILFDDDFRGFGPRVGASGAYRFGTSAFSIFGDAAVAYLFGRRKTDIIANHETAQNHGGHPDSLNVTGQLGLAYDVAPNTSIAVGYRADFWSNVASSKGDMHGGDGPQLAYGGGDRLMHGPFVRLAYNIGAPRGAAPAPVAAPPAAVMAKSFIVFFDFDRSNLTPTALGTIKQAADAAKAGQSARVNVTGHADKSGGDQYNMALSLRRANTVKDELMRQGVPAASIVVVGRGESQPLVPTADGVKEPQNRRVEIVLN